MAALISLCLALLPIPMPGQDGVYNTWSRLSWCSNERACIHERAHALDQTLGWPSHSTEFGRALEIYVINQVKSERPDALAGDILDWPGIFQPAPGWGWDPRGELYAHIYTQAGGNIARIPAELRRFYGQK